MKRYEMDLCTGALWKKILLFSVPLMFTNLLQVVFNMSDVAVVGKFAGSLALGSVRLNQHPGHDVYRHPHRHGKRRQCADRPLYRCQK